MSPQVVRPSEFIFDLELKTDLMQSVNTTAGSAEPVAGDVVPSTNEDSKQTETPPVPQNEAVPASGHDVTSVAATQEVRTPRGFLFVFLGYNKSSKS